MRGLEGGGGGWVCEEEEKEGGETESGMYNIFCATHLVNGNNIGFVCGKFA